MPESKLRIAITCSSNMNRSMEAHSVLRVPLKVRTDKSDLVLYWKPNSELHIRYRKFCFKNGRYELDSIKWKQRWCTYFGWNKNFYAKSGTYLLVTADKKGYYVKSFGTGDKVKLPGTAIDKPNIYDFNCTYDEIYNDLTRKDKAFYTQNGLLHMLDRNRRIKLKPEKFQLCNEQFDLIITCEERVYDQVIDYFNSKSPLDNTPVHIINVDIQDNQEEATIGAFFICELVNLVSKCEDLDNDLVRLLPEYEKKCNRSLLHCMLFY